MRDGRRRPPRLLPPEVEEEVARLSHLRDGRTAAGLAAAASGGDHLGDPSEHSDAEVGLSIDRSSERSSDDDSREESRRGRTNRSFFSARFNRRFDARREWDDDGGASASGGAGSSGRSARNVQASGARVVVGSSSGERRGLRFCSRASWRAPAVCVCVAGRCCLSWSPGRPASKIRTRV